MPAFKLHNESIIVGLDVGTSCLRCAVVKRDSELPFHLIAYAEKPCQAFDEGKIINFEEAAHVLTDIFNEVEKQAAVHFTELNLGFSSPFNSFFSRGMAALPSREVGVKEIEQAIETACAVPLSTGHVQIHGTPQMFQIDSQDHISSPLGLSGLRLETKVHIVSVQEFYFKDLTKVLKDLGYFPKNFIHNTLAYGENLLDLRQKNQGVSICDIGHRSSRILVYRSGQVVDMFPINFGGETLNASLASEFKISLEQAESLKKKYLSFESKEVENKQLELDRSGLFVSREVFFGVINEKLRGFMKQVKQKLIEKNLFEHLHAGMVWTGRTSYISGFLDFAYLELGLNSTHPRNFISGDFNRTHTFAIAQQVHQEARSFKQNKFFSSPWEKIKELF